jgi:hypothetical protein
VVVAAHTQNRRLPALHRVLDTPTCREQALGVQPLTVGFERWVAQPQPPQQKAHLRKAHQAARAVRGLGQVLALLFTLAAAAAHQCFKPQPQTNSVAAVVLVLLAQMV